MTPARHLSQVVARLWGKFMKAGLWSDKSHSVDECQTGCGRTQGENTGGRPYGADCSPELLNPLFAHRKSTGFMESGPGPDWPACLDQQLPGGWRWLTGCGSEWTWGRIPGSVRSWTHWHSHHASKDLVLFPGTWWLNLRWLFKVKAFMPGQNGLSGAWVDMNWPEQKPIAIECCWPPPHACLYTL